MFRRFHMFEYQLNMAETVGFAIILLLFGRGVHDLEHDAFGQLNPHDPTLKDLELDLHILHQVLGGLPQHLRRKGQLIVRRQV